MLPLRALSALFCIILASSCAPSIKEEAQEEAPHVIVLIADDLGLSEAPCHSDDVRMPFLQSKCEESLVFERAYTHPYCTASRATLMTGRHPFRHGADDVRAQARKLPLSEVTIAEYITQNSRWDYETAAFGKWHLADDENGSELNPNQQGFEHFEGNPRQHHTYHYFDYDWYENGKLVGTRPEYKTTYITDAVISYFDKHAGKSAQFTMVGYTNPHKPYHEPPEHLHSYGDLPPIALKGVTSDQPGPNEYRTNRREARFDVYYYAMLEALDTEIERLVTRLSQDTDRPIVFVFVGDNGSAGEVFPGAEGKAVRSKATLYDGGVRIPVMVWSSQPERYTMKTGRSLDLVHLADFFPTLAGIAGVDWEPDGAFQQELDGVPVQLRETGRGEVAETERDFVFLERGNNEKLPFAYAGVDRDGLKIILREAGRSNAYSEGVLVEIYDTKADPLEVDNLLKTPCGISAERMDGLYDFIAGKARQNRVHHNWFDEGFYRGLIADARAQCGV